MLTGVDDAGNALDLENDYASLDGDRDRFEVHLRNILNEQFGVCYTKTDVAISLPDIEGVIIGQIEVNKAREPIVVKQKDRNGQTQEKVYVRSGNASQEIRLGELRDYWRTRFV